MKIQVRWLAVCSLLAIGSVVAGVANPCSGEERLTLHKALYHSEKIALEAIRTAEDLEVLNEDGDTALCVAGNLGSSAYVLARELLWLGADPNASCGGTTPLVSASVGGDIPVATLLLDFGADINLVPPGRIYPPVIRALRAGKFEVATMLEHRGALIEPRERVDAIKASVTSEALSHYLGNVPREGDPKELFRREYEAHIHARLAALAHETNQYRADFERACFTLALEYVYDPEAGVGFDLWMNRSAADAWQRTVDAYGSRYDPERLERAR